VPRGRSGAPPGYKTSSPTSVSIVEAPEGALMVLQATACYAAALQRELGVLETSKPRCLCACDGLRDWVETMDRLRTLIAKTSEYAKVVLDTLPPQDP
jgi:hypothetical protein